MVTFSEYNDFVYCFFLLAHLLPAILVYLSYIYYIYKGEHSGVQCYV